MRAESEDEPDVASLAAQWTGLSIASSVVRMAGGRANRTYLITPTDGDRLVFRWYEPDFSPGRDPATIGYEHEVLRRLSALGLPVSGPQQHLGRTVGEARGRYFALFSYLPGEPFALGDPALIDHAAVTLARVHASTDAVRDLGQRPSFESYVSLDWVAPERPAAEWFTALDGLTHDGSPLPWRALLRTLRSTLAKLRESGYAGHTPVLVHGDINENNLLGIEGRLTGVLDFDSCHLDSPAMDIAAAIWQICRVPPAFDAFEWAMVAHLVRVYQLQHPIPIEYYEIVPAAIRAWLLVYYLWSARRLLLTGDERAVRALGRSMGPSRLGLVARDGDRLQRALQSAVRSVS